MGNDPGEGLKQIAGVSGAGPVFDVALLEALEWASQHYVAPLSVLLSQATPPNLPKSMGSPAMVPGSSSSTHPLGEAASAVARGRRRAATALVGSWTDLAWLDALAPILASGRSVAIITATAAEAARVGEAWSRSGGRAVTVAGGAAAEITTAWEEAQTPGKLVVGTPRISSWRIAGLGMVVVLEEGRRAMKERHTPTIHVRDLVRTRSRVEGFAAVFFGPTPSVEVLAAGAETIHVGNRAWPLVEVVNRAEDPPGGGYLSERVVAALRAMRNAGSRSFVFTHRRVGFASMRCTRCRTIRQCPRCGTRVGRVDRCPRCGSEIGACVSCGGVEFEEMGTIPERLVSEINSRVGSGSAAQFPEEGLISVGTERDLATLRPMALVVAADADGMLMAHGYRASEEALRQLARLANSLESGPGRRMMVQTSHPESSLIGALRRGDPVPYLEGVLVDRARDRVPPAVEMIAVELRDGRAIDLVAELGATDSHDVIGPMESEEGARWLIQGDLREPRRRLRDVVARLREAGVSVRVDADPIDV